MYMYTEVETKRLQHGAVLENGATFEGGAVFFLNNHLSCYVYGSVSRLLLRVYTCISALSFAHEQRLPLFLVMNEDLP